MRWRAEGWLEPGGGSTAPLGKWDTGACAGNCGGERAGGIPHVVLAARASPTAPLPHVAARLLRMCYFTIGPGFLKFVYGLLSHLGVGQVQMTQLGHARELLQSRIGNLCAFQIQGLKLIQGHNIFQAGVGDVVAAQVECLELSQSRDLLESGIGYFEAHAKPCKLGNSLKYFISELVVSWQSPRQRQVFRGGRHQILSSHLTRKGRGTLVPGRLAWLRVGGIRRASMVARA